VNLLLDRSNKSPCLKDNIRGTSLGWLIYPDERIILAFTANQSPVELSGSDRLPVLAGLNLSITVDDIFGLLRSPGKTLGNI
jgi:hypothetical protein